VHITGGGLIENPPRIFDDRVSFRLNCATTPLPPVFSWIRDMGNMELSELARTFNCGIGLIIYVDANKAGEVLDALQTGPEPEAWIVGELVNRDNQPAVILDGVDHWRRRT
jgi:phosphoribosylformylglycinamidine cyclo-ligase